MKTNRKPLPELTFCIPVRIDSPYRLRNLTAVLTFYTRRVEANYILLEADTAQRIPHEVLNRFPSLRYEFVKDESLLFHRTRYINRMLAGVPGRAAAVWDADAIVPVAQLEQAYRLITTAGTVLAYPYNGRFWDIDDYYSSFFCRKTDIRILTDTQTPRQFMGKYYSSGGAFLVDVESYRACGWENEYFPGWGPEDEERYKRLEILGHAPRRTKGGLYHLYHPRGVNSGYPDAGAEYAAKKEFCKVCGLPPGELRSYIRTWPWISGDNRKIR